MPIWSKTHGKEYEGLVIAERSYQSYPGGDTNFYAIVWDNSDNCPHERQIGTNAYAWHDRTEIDATPEIMEKYRSWCQATGCDSIEDQKRAAVRKKEEEQARAERERRERVKKEKEEQIARQKQEMARRLEQRQQIESIMLERNSLKQCGMCGQPLGTMDRLFGRRAHRGCVSFVT